MAWRPSVLAKTGSCLPLAVVALLFALHSPIYVRAQVSSPSQSSVQETRTATPASQHRSKPASSQPTVDSRLLQEFLGNCCKNTFLPRKPSPPKVTPPLAPNSRHLWSPDDPLIPVAIPVYIPYAIGYEPDESDLGEETGEEGGDSAPTRSRLEPQQLVNYDSYSEFPADESDDEAETPPPPEEPVVTQPATVLVYRDGHRAEVVNYAILGDALFDFDDERTRKIPLTDLDLTATAKANDLRGVDFKLPASYVRSTPR